MNQHKSNPYNKTGYRNLPETWDMDFVNHISETYLDHWLPEGEEQNWEHIEKSVHADFDERFGHAEVSRHLKLVRS